MEALEVSSSLLPFVLFQGQHPLSLGNEEKKEGLREGLRKRARGRGAGGRKRRKQKKIQKKGKENQLGAN